MHMITPTTKSYPSAVSVVLMLRSPDLIIVDDILLIICHVIVIYITSVINLRVVIRMIMGKRL